ncbi:MAG: iron-sulfur cluster assembly protein [Acetobacteraceae bacterium]
MNASVEDRRQQVMARLDRVTDPELDEPVTELGFITGVDVDDGLVGIRFRLPTYWCSANFAFLMADDMRREVGRLDWVRDVRVQLGEHMEAERINAGMRDGLTFRESFAEAADAELDVIRATFARKSFQHRQHQLLQRLRGDGHAPEAIVAMTVGRLRGLTGEAVARLVERYLERRGVPGAFDDASAAFVDTEGVALAAGSLGAYLRTLRNVTVNMEFNGALCRGLLAARFDEPQPADTGPDLRHFLREAARATHPETSA